MKKKKANKINFNIMDFFYTINFNQCRCMQILKTLALTGAEKSATKYFTGEKKNGQIKGMISMRMLILS